ncbi:MAG: response regulator transcription factor [Nitrospirota bacterium]
MQRPVMIVEDDKKMAKFVKAYLEGEGFTVVHFEKGKAALASAKEEMPLLVILDLMLPDMKGEDVFQELKELGDIPVIMLTAKSSEEERLAGFALGADDYVVKPFSPREVVFRVKSVLKRSEKEDLSMPKTLSYHDGELIIDGGSFEVTKKGEVVQLTPTEFRVLFALASNPARVFTREEIVEKALGYNFEGYERSVDVHVRNLRSKLEDDPKHPRFILTVYGLGYRFSGKKDET